MIESRIDTAIRHLGSAARAYALGHYYLALLDLGLALRAVSEAMTSIVHQAVPGGER